ncbi:MAG TPA: hypothetical protein VGP93_00290 [Polyangiaceae bacterium]|nr:hypothetical protein [Polyangiaceae bacterium]
MISARRLCTVRAWRVASLWTALLLGCGGGSAGSKPAAAAEGNEKTGASPAASDGHADTEQEEADEPAAKRDPCEDGTCSSCGSGICPSGWYCDESAKGGPACGWLPDCASKLSCGCVSRVFSSCSCQEKSGGVHVTCG